MAMTFKQIADHYEAKRDAEALQNMATLADDTAERYREHVATRPWLAGHLAECEHEAAIARAALKRVQGGA